MSMSNRHQNQAMGISVLAGAAAAALAAASDADLEVATGAAGSTAASMPSVESASNIAPESTMPGETDEARPAEEVFDEIAAELESDAGLVQNDDQLTTRTEAEIDSHLASAIEDEAARIEAEKAAGERAGVIHPVKVTRGNYLAGSGEMTETELRTELARLGDPIAQSRAVADERARVHAESREIIAARREIDGKADSAVREAQEHQQWALERIGWIKKALGTGH
jgi:hypothetical protein